MRHSLWLIATFVILLAGCSSSGTLGLVTKSTADPASLLRQGRGFKELGPVQAKVCRHFVLAIIPWGDSNFSSAVDKALIERGGDALLNVTVETSLYGFIPIYNVYTFTCTTVQGIAIKFE
jgi:hypothetical protein